MPVHHTEGDRWLARRSPSLIRYFCTLSVLTVVCRLDDGTLRHREGAIEATQSTRTRARSYSHTSRRGQTCTLHPNSAPTIIAPRYEKNALPLILLRTISTSPPHCAVQARIKQSVCVQCFGTIGTNRSLRAALHLTELVPPCINAGCMSTSQGNS